MASMGNMIEKTQRKSTSLWGVYPSEVDNRYRGPRSGPVDTCVELVAVNVPVKVPVKGFDALASATTSPKAIYRAQNWDSQDRFAPRPS